MAEERTHHAIVRLAHDYQFVAEFPDVPGAAPVLFDEPAPLGGDTAPNAAAVLGAAIGNCLAASLTFCLRRARMDVADMTAQVVTHVTKNERGRYRVTGIDVELTPTLGGATVPQFERCGALFEDFCIVTASVQHGIPVHVSLKTQDKAA
jgi:uncharacterized OsmC-like protein